MRPAQLSTTEVVSNLQKLQKLSSLWNIKNEQLCAEFEFPSFEHTADFVNIVICLAKKQNHHPQVIFGYRQCHVCYTTHSAGGLTMLDFSAATDLSTAIIKAVK